MTASSFVDLDVPPDEEGQVAEFLRYFFCSSAALGADFTVFTAGYALGWGYPASAAIAFTVGLWVAYTFSVRYVFRARTFSNKRLEFAAFAIIGLVGLLLTEALLCLLSESLGFHPVIAKCFTAAVVFVFNYGARKALLFSRTTTEILP